MPTVGAATIGAVGLAIALGTASLSAQGATAQTSRLAPGMFLVASRELRDPSFAETAVLLLRYGSDGALGLVVNRPTQMKLADLLPEIEGIAERDDTVYVGGPVMQENMLLLVRSDDEPPESQQVMDDVYFSGSKELLARLVGQEEKEDGGEFRVFAGHAGWAPGQLEWEVKRGGWHVLRAESTAVFDTPPEKLWPELIRRSSGVWASLNPGAIGSPASGTPRQRARRAARDPRPAAAPRESGAASR